MWSAVRDGGDSPCRCRAAALGRIALIGPFDEAAAVLHWTGCRSGCQRELGGAEVQLHSALTSALGGRQWSIGNSLRFTPGEEKTGTR